jgi:hypothetical protein
MLLLLVMITVQLAAGVVVWLEIGRGITHATHMRIQMARHQLLSRAAAAAGAPGVRVSSPALAAGMQLGQVAAPAGRGVTGTGSAEAALLICQLGNTPAALVTMQQQLQLQQQRLVAGVVSVMKGVRLAMQLQAAHSSSSGRVRMQSLQRLLAGQQAGGQRRRQQQQQQQLVIRLQLQPHARLLLHLLLQGQLGLSSS